MVVRTSLEDYSQTKPQEEVSLAVSQQAQPNLLELDLVLHQQSLHLDQIPTPTQEEDSLGPRTLRTNHSFLVLVS